ncbi:double-stranded RNA-binding protein 1-like isoform X2 [Phalaenopsis equestris]|uniref:double-stranded RNA-binding protein 1-like isoform X2 n=1 Tax=Phalaenopsis equestris TaxID=78828 RepID=UPI0009E18A29|nr:double-stranded RNA-binding protein 1-like isoform X2 [Phalaenopsis equestris]
MHKNRLQELCQKRSWPLPTYTASREGPDHNPEFGASVLVSGQTFDSPNLFKSLKEAQNKAAEVALDSLSAISSASSAPDHPAGDESSPAAKAQIFYKSQLQQYVQKRNIGAPKYVCLSDGSAHAHRFKARVTVDGQTFESTQYFRSLREAEHSAARVALMSLPLEENQQDEPNFYKNLLQQLAQKKGLCLPKYNTVSEDESHMRIFRSTVEIHGKSFVGDVGRTKKQAEMNAAKVALNHVEGRINSHSIRMTCGDAMDNLEHPKIHAEPPSSITTDERNQTAEENGAITEVTQPATGLSPKYQVKLNDSPIPARNQPNLNAIPSSTLKIKEAYQATCDINFQEKQNRFPVPISNENIKEKQANGKVEDERVVTNKTDHEVLSNTSMIINELDDDTLFSDCTDKLNLSNLKLGSSTNSDINSQNVEHHDEIFSGNHVDQLNLTASKLDLDGKAKEEESNDCSSGDVDDNDNKVVDADIGKIFDSPSLLCNRVLVYPCKPDIVLPVGATLMPFSDSAWVAVSLDFSEHENLPNIL